MKKYSEYCIQMNFVNHTFDPSVLGGIELLYVRGELFVSNLTSSPIHLQSWIGNDKLNHHKSTVVELAPQYQGIEMFDLQIYLQLMHVIAFYFLFKIT